MIISPFNSVFLAVFALYVCLIVFTYFLFKNKSETLKRNFIIGFCCFNIVLFFVYKGFLSVDNEFLQISEITKFNWFAELPLQLCNINMFLIPIGLLTKKRALLGFSSYLAPLGAFFALICPEPSFIGFSLFVPRIFGFYITHFNIFAAGILLMTFGFYKPKYKSLPGITITFVIVAFIIHLINLLLNVTVCPNANYFFAENPGGVGLLELFWSWLPVKYFYLIPAIAILLTYMVFICTINYLVEKITANKNKELVLSDNK